MRYRGMVVLENEDFGETMELVSCIKEAACKLSKHLSNAKMSRHMPVDDKDDYEDDEYDEDRYMENNPRHEARKYRMGGRYRY